jgi:hypothetical protein
LNIQDYNFVCDSVWMLNLVSDIKEQHRLRAFESRLLRRLFGPKTDEVTGRWRKLHNDVVRDLYSSPSTIIIIIRMSKSRRMR